MKDLIQLLRWDIILLHRNRIFILAIAVAAIYTGLFFLLRPLGNLSDILVVLIMNDPVVTGYLFAAVLLLFDKNQNTLQAISVLPLPFRSYLFSKALLLSALATVTALAMTLSTRGWDFQPVHLMVGTFLSTFIFASFGFVVSSWSRNFNQLLFYSIPFFILSGLPLLYLAGFGSLYYYFCLPSAGTIGILQAAFKPQPAVFVAAMYVHLIVWSLISWRLALRIATRHLS